MPEVEGNLLKKDMVYGVIQEAVDFANVKVSLEEEDCYETPVKRQNDETMARTVEKLNTCISTDYPYVSFWRTFRESRCKKCADGSAMTILVM
ncbi:MAG: hypothetical protein V8T31_05010 [Lachnospiraceae bacterium]